MKRRSPPYRVYSLAADGTRRPIVAHGIIIRIRRGIEIELPLAPDLVWKGDLCLITPPFDKMKAAVEAGLLDSMHVRYSSPNIVHLSVERTTVKKRVRRPRRRS